MHFYHKHSGKLSIFPDMRICEIFNGDNCCVFRFKLINNISNSEDKNGKTSRGVTKQSLTRYIESPFLAVNTVSDFRKHII